MKALALCHNVSPVEEEEEEDGKEVWSMNGAAARLNGDARDGDDEEAILFEKDFQRHGNERGLKVSYQASSPDEVSECMKLLRDN